MSLNDIQKNIVNAIPFARRYGRALTGDTNLTDLVLTQASQKLIERAPPSSLLLPSKMILPLLFIEFHHLLDSNSENTPSSMTDHTQAAAQSQDAPLYEKIDHALSKLSPSQRRVFLLTALEQFQPIVIGRILSITVTDVKQQFQQAHMIVNESITANAFDQAA